MARVREGAQKASHVGMTRTLPKLLTEAQAARIQELELLVV
jgi:hypothetical protein